jgi:hypothetical protein
MRGVGVLLASLVAVALVGGSSSAADRRAPGAGTRAPIAVSLPLPRETITVQPVMEEKPPACFDKLPRATEDRPDSGDDLLHVVYLVAADFPDEDLDTNGTIDCSMQAQNQWFLKQSGNLQWRLDTFKATVKSRSGKRKKIEALDVTFIKSDKKGADLYGADLVSAELQTRGLAEMNKRYLTYVAAGDDSGPCGDAFLDSFDPMSSGDGQFAQIYMFSAEGCHAHEFGVPGAPSFVEAIGQQEIMHNDGAVTVGSPHFCTPGLFHVCTGPLSVADLRLDPETIDVMFPYVTDPLSEKVLDSGNDDYFQHPFPYKDVAESRYLESVGS